MNDIMKKTQKWILILGLALAGRALAADGGAPAQYTGTAVDDKGKPVAGAAVTCYQDASAVAAYAAQDFALKEQGVTDSKGGFSVSAGGGVTVAVVKKEGLAPGWKIFGAGAGEAGDPVVLTAPASLAGVVVDEKGQPVADAEVWVAIAMPVSQSGIYLQGLVEAIGGKPARDCFSTRTAADGSFRIANFPADCQADLGVGKPGKVLRVRANFGGTLAWASGQQNIKLTLEAAASIEGKVTAGETGQPLSGVKLRWAPMTGGFGGLNLLAPIVSGADGAFRMVDLPSGRLMITAVFPGEPVADWVAENVTVTVAAGETNKDVAVRAVRGGVAAITVLSQNGRQPLASARVTAVSPVARSSASGVTGADGVAWLRLLPNDWNISAFKEGWSSGPQTDVTVETGQTNREEIELQPDLKITGTARDPAGAPVAGAMVSVSPANGLVREVKTDAGGRFEIVWQMNSVGGFPAGVFEMPTYSILARSVERNLVARHEIDETTTNLDLTLQPGLILSAKVEDNTGKPVTNAAGYVPLVNASGAAIPFKSDAQGHIQITAMPEADGYSFYLTAKGYGPFSRQLQASDRQTNRLEFPAIVLAVANQKLAGKVLDVDGKPASGIMVQCYGVSQPNATAETDSEGRFSFDAVCEGPVQLNATLRSSPGDMQSANAQTAGGDTNVVLRLAQNRVNGRMVGAAAGVKVAGTVRDPAGAPAAGVRVWLWPPAGNENEVRTDTNGRYSILWQKQYFGGGNAPLIVARDEEHNLSASHELEDAATNLDLSLQPGLTLVIKAQDVHGKPIPTAAATLFLYSGNMGTGFGRTPTKADDQGVIQFKALPQERSYMAAITAKGYGTTNLSAQTGETKTTRLEFPAVVLQAADRKLAGQVLGVDGKPFRRAAINIQGEGQPALSTNTDAQGRFAFEGVCEGTVQVSANGPSGAGGNNLYGSTQAQGGDTNVVIQFAANSSWGGPDAKFVMTSGTVLDPSGAPASGARLLVMPGSGMNMELKSGADGKYSVTWQEQNGRGGQNIFILARDLERHLTASHSLDDTATNLDLRLQPALTLAFKVQDTSGRPIPAATEVLLVRLETQSFNFSPGDGKANDQGVIEIKDLPQAWSYSATIRATGYGTTNVQVQAAETRTNRFEFPAVVLKAADRKLAGQVLGPDGKPLSRASVNMQGAGQPVASTTTDAQGHFVFNTVAEGPVQLSANSPARAGGNSMYGNYKAEAGDTNVVIRFAINGNGGMPNARLVTTSGTVLDPSGAPVAGARLSVLPGNDINSAVLSEADGKYSVTWQEQNFGNGAAYFIYARDVERDLALGQDLDETATNLNLRLKPALTLSVKVQDAKGKPIPTATAGLIIWYGNMASGFNQTAVTANAQGVIEFKGLPQERRYGVTITAPGYGTAGIEAQIEDTKAARFELPAAVLKAADRKLAGRVLGPDSKPFPRATVSLGGEGQPATNTTTDAQGHFAFNAVSEGPVRVVANGQGANGNYMSGSIQAQGGDTNVVIRFGINGNGSMDTAVVTTSGTVLDASGAPVSGARLSVFPGNGMNMDVRSGEDGKYSITWQKPNYSGQITFIFARDAERHLTASHDLDDTATNLDLRLQPALTLSVKVQDAKGKPIPTATATLLVQAENSSYAFSQTQATANDQGVIEFKDLPQERRYNASIAAPGYGSVILQAQISDTKTNRFEFPATVLKEAGRKLAGLVLGPDSKPLSRANVTMQGEGQPNATVTSDTQGHFVFNAVAEGPVQLYANSQGAGGGYMNTSAQAQGGDTNVVIRFAINGNGGVPNATLVTTSGTVLDPSGAPVAGARLSVIPGSSMNVEVRSDADGKYSVTWQQQNFGNGAAYFIYARDVERDLAVGQDLDDTATNLNLRLQPALTLSVKVQDAKDKPIPTATATLIIWSGNMGSSGNQTPATANAQGVIEIKGLAQERRYGVNIAARGYGTATVIAQAADTQTNHFDFPTTVLKAADRKLAGQVLGLDGKPVPRANVNIQGAGQPFGNTNTDAQGRFAFDAVCEGPVQLNANSQSANGNYMNGSIQAQGGDTNVVIRFGINGQGGPANMQIVTTSGTVLDPSGAPVSGAQLSVMPGYGMNAEVRSGADGKFSITWQAQSTGARAGTAAARLGGAVARRGGATMPAPAYLLVGRDLEHNLASAVEIDEKTTNADVHLQTALTISGSVLDSAGAPVKNATIGVILWSGNRGASFGQQQPAKVDAQGAFSFSNFVQNQRYTLNVTATGYGSANSQLAADDTAAPSVQLPPITLKLANLKLEGQVVDADDKPVPGAQMSINGVGQPTSVGMFTDAKGHFAFTHVCEGALQVMAIKIPAGFTSGALPAGSTGNAQAQGGDLNVVVKLGAGRVAAMAGPAMRQAPARTTPPKPLPWTLAALQNWPQHHRTAIIVLFCLQMAASVGVAGAILWLTRKKGD